MIRNLGQVAAIYIGSSAPRNTNLIWLDNTVVPFVFRAYDGSAWSELATHKWVQAYVDGWLVTLPPRQLADDGDYMLINSNNVNYKITVKDFVKSAVGNPLDFKGVIRTSENFPDPSTLESGDMYVIITSPAGGTVTDPYSGKVFEDSEKIVWDEVTKSWESLGKIDIKVDLTTSYSETEVTIHSSAGKETTIQGATDQLAGVMLPGQYSWLQALSNGSTVPGDPSPLNPLTPAHKHNYGDIIDRLISQQETGESTINPMSQKATTDALNLKFDKASVLQVSGAATDKVMSQKAVTDALKTLSDDFNNKLTKYLPLAGGTMTGNIRFPVNNGIACSDVAGTAAYVVLRTWNANNTTRMYVGAVNFPTYISSTASDLIHDRNGSSYLLWDSYNVSKPVNYNEGDTGKPKTIYDRNLGVNGSMWTFLSAINAATTSIFAPTTAGTKGYYLVSTGTGAPVWQQLEDLGDGKYLPLAGGVMTGSITLSGANPALRAQLNDISIHLASISSTGTTLYGDSGYPMSLATSEVDIIHTRNNTAYKIWDAFNLKDPATQSWVTGQGYYKKDSSGPTFTDYVKIDAKDTSSSWAREYGMGNTGVATSHVRYGGYGTGNTAQYAYIGIGDVTYSTAQYKFKPASLAVPASWSIDDPSGNSLIWTPSSTLINLGRAVGTTKIRSGATDLIHTKGSTDYKILDESNYTQFIPQDITWTHGFVSVQVGEGGYDANSMVGADKPKLLFNYYSTGLITGAPEGMRYGNILQIDGPYNSSYGVTVLRTQLAFDITHNVDNGTGRMWFRTANNKGMTVANWKRVLTADENVASLSFDTNGYPAIVKIGGTSYTWMRVSGSGLLPNVAKSFAEGGMSNLGTSTWTFNAAYINHIHTMKVTFGNTGPYMTASDTAFQFLTSIGAANKVATGGIYVGDDYNELSKVPNLGILSRGIIRTERSTANSTSGGYFLVGGSTTNATGGQYGYGFYYTSSDFLPISGLGTKRGNTFPMLYERMLPDLTTSNQWKAAADIKTSPTAFSIEEGSAYLYVGTAGTYAKGDIVPVTKRKILTESDGNSKYLPLTGGTLTGQVTIKQSVDAKLRLQATDADNYSLIQALSSSGSTLGVFGYAGNKWAVGHGDAYYEIWDKYNLQNPATQAWVNSQNFVKSTSTKKVTDIQPVDALPATQASGVLYLVFE